ncbi:MAG: FAD-binding oxidoreductase [Caldilineaceae bacterium SB0661_bin_32]|uniref:FAD-binding oxidoreductase n=1 Tax=Caldilineaceae bacterium SB0661_bin_32 TaxID=2605255 RepID=A0A6B1D5P6_9CHLR|nr:FAD-binding oxidoreductase [Caldilineaceae bacterium SB0661_bin_32]
MPRFIVIGGGAIGLNTAYRLARMQSGQVTLLDKGLVGDGSSSRAGGIITGLLWSETGVLARMISLRLYQELSADLERYGYRFQNVGCLNLFDPASWTEREALLPLYDRLGFAYEVLDAAQMRRRWPDLTPEADLIGLHDALGGYSEPHEFVPALARRCRDLGVEIRENAGVNGLQIENGRVVGVQTAMGLLEADVVICTVHAWTAAFMERCGVRLPVKSFVHQRYVSSELQERVSIPAINANPYGGYIRPARLGTTDFRILAGGETEDREEERVDGPAFHMSVLSAPRSLRSHLSKNLAPLVPKLAATHWETEQVGLISFSLDSEPVLGKLPQLPGLVVGAAFHSGGFAYSPVAGLLLAELAAGKSPSVDISSFSPGRFTAEETDAYLATTVVQADAFRRRH